MPRPSALPTNSVTKSGVRWADITRLSCATPNFASVSLAERITSQSDLLPIIMPTSGDSLPLIVFSFLEVFSFGDFDCSRRRLPSPKNCLGSSTPTHSASGDASYNTNSLPGLREHMPGSSRQFLKSELNVQSPHHARPQSRSVPAGRRGDCRGGEFVATRRIGRVSDR